MEKKSMALAIRKAGERDVTEVYRLIESYKFDEKGGSLLSLTQTEISRLVANGNFFVADVDGNTAGCASVVAYNGVAELRSLAVSPDRQRRGIGSSLIDACVKKAQYDGHQELYVLIQEKDARTFSNHGFVHTETPPQKLMKDCVVCPKYRTSCNETAVVYRF